MTPTVKVEESYLDSSESSPKQSNIKNDSKQKLSNNEVEVAEKQFDNKLNDVKSEQKSELLEKVSVQISKLQADKEDRKTDRTKLHKQYPDSNPLFEPEGQLIDMPIDMNAYEAKLDKYNARTTEIDRQISEIKRTRANRR